LPETDPRDDQELIAAANRGEEDAFAALYYRYRDWAVRLAWRFTGNQADALDVLQDTFTYLFRKFPGFRLTANMTTFLYPAVKNLSLKVIRRRRRTIVSDEIVEAVSPSTQPEPPDTRAELAEVMAGLPETHREVVLMRYVDDLSLAEIAEALDIPLGTVKSRLHNALRMLKDDPRTRRYFLED
jgi:RNA polymerase sigma-70 factor (ECF subfamily)